MSESSTYQKLRGHLAYLRLTAAADALAPELERAQHEQLTHSAFLERLLQVEVSATEERRLAGRQRFACLPAPWRLEDFDFTAQPKLDRKLIEDLATLRFVEEAANVLFIGPPGHATYCITSSLLIGKQSNRLFVQFDSKAIALS